MANCAIVGINWGDEGKGRMVDLLTEDYDVVVRFQGGGNAGHTVINEKGKFALHLLPSGIFRSGVVNILGNGVALDPENLWMEMQDVMAKGVNLLPKISKLAIVPLFCSLGTGIWMSLRKCASQIKNTVQPNKASPRFIRINIRRRPFLRANCSTRKN